MKAGTAGNIIVCDWPKNVPEFYLFYVYGYFLHEKLRLDSLFLYI